MTQNQIQELIFRLRQATDIHEVTPQQLATIFETLNSQDPTQSAALIDARPCLGCEVRGNLLYLLNHAYYERLGCVPILFRMVKKRNRYRIAIDNRSTLNASRCYSPKRKGWQANGQQGTITVNGTGLVKRHVTILNSLKEEPTEYVSNPDVFVNNGDTQKMITWGNAHISHRMKNSTRMLRLPFAIGYAFPKKSQSERITLENLVSNLAVFYVRGFHPQNESYHWTFNIK